MLKKGIIVTALISLLIVMGCMSKDDREINKYIKTMNEDSDVTSDLNESINEIFSLVDNGKAEEAHDKLINTTISIAEDTLEKYKKMDLENEDIIELNNLVAETYDSNLELLRTLQRIFTIIIEDFKDNTPETINFLPELDNITAINAHNFETQMKIKEKSNYLIENYRGLKHDSTVDEQIETIDPEILNELYATLVWEFLVAIADDDIDIETILEKSLKQHGNETNENNNRNDSNTSSSSLTRNIEEMLQKQGSPYVVFDAEVSIEDTFVIKGRSNLQEGSTVELTSKIYGQTNIYLDGEMIVDENGDFELELEIDEDDLNGDPVLLTLGYTPASEHADIQEIHGEQGELLEGPFVRSYSSIKRTRTGAATDAMINFEKGVKKKFSVKDLDIPQDYGELNIWMEVDELEVFDNYYNVTMKSNLIRLTDTRIEIEIPGYQLAGYRGLGITRDDGSFQIQIPRLDEELEFEEEVFFAVEAFANSTIETEELYGTYGDKFEGNLVEKTNRGQKIVYKFNLHDIK